MKIRKLQKLVFKALQESGISEDETKLRDTLMGKVTSRNTPFIFACSFTVVYWVHVFIFSDKLKLPVCD